MSAFGALVDEARDVASCGGPEMLDRLADAVEGLVLLVAVLSAEPEAEDCQALQRRTIRLLAENAALRLSLAESGLGR